MTLFCSECMTFHSEGKHSSQWDAWMPDNDEHRGDNKAFCAVDEEEAAEKFAATLDEEGDYSIVGGQETKVCVARVGEEQVFTFMVTGESCPVYSAKKIS